MDGGVVPEGAPVLGGGVDLVGGRKIDYAYDDLLVQGEGNGDGDEGVGVCMCVWMFVCVGG